MQDRKRTPANTAGNPTEGAAPPGNAPRVQEYRYDAFISYRHVDPDRGWAKWLHTALETYRVPQYLRRHRRLPARLTRVFRDEEELPASADLNGEIETALRQSRFLIVVCSPRTPESEWVNKEVVRFRQLGRHDRIIALLTEGEPVQSFPRSLREIRRKLIDSRGRSSVTVEQIEPLAADVRDTRDDESPRYLKRMAKLRILACILGVSFDDLRRRDQERQVRRIAAIGAGGGVLATVLLLLLLLLASARREVVEVKKDVEKKQKHIKTVEKKVEEQKVVVEEKTRFAEEKKQEALVSDELKRQEIYIGDMSRAWDAWKRNDIPRVSRELDKYDPAKSPDGAKYRGEEWHRLKTLMTSWRQTIAFEGFALSVRFSPDGSRIAAMGYGPAKQFVKVWKFPSRELEYTLQLGPKHGAEALDAPWHVLPCNGRQSVAYSPDGTLVAGTCLVVEAKRRLGVVKAWNTSTGQEVFSYAGDKVAGHAVAFSPDGTYLIAGGYDGGGLSWTVGDQKLAWELPDDDWVKGPRPGPGASGFGHPPVTTLLFNHDGTALSRIGSDHVSIRQRKLGKPMLGPWPPKKTQAESRAQIEQLRQQQSDFWNEWMDDIVAYSPGGRWAVAPIGDQSEAVYLLDFQGRPIKPLRSIRRQKAVEVLPATINLENRIRCVALCDRYLALAAEDARIMLGRLDPNGHSIGEREFFSGHEGEVSGIAFSTDHKWITAAGSMRSGSSQITIWPTDEKAGGR